MIEELKFGKTRIDLFLGDALKVLKDLPDESIDGIVTDPPYGIANEVLITRRRNGLKFKKGKDISHNFGKWDKFEDIEKYLEFTYMWIDECIRVLKKGRMFISFFDRDKINFISHYLQEKGFKMKGYFAFVKSNPVPQARKVQFRNGWEEAGLWQKEEGKLVFNYQYGQQADYVIHSICGGKERTKHPTQKPLKVIEPLIKYWHNEGEWVLDPFMGSGTMGLLCKKYKINFVGIEQNKEYFEIAKQRIECGKVLKIKGYKQGELW